MMYNLSNHPVEGVRLHCTFALEISQSQRYDAFVKVTNDISMQDKWIADKDWVCHIQNQDGLKDCNVSHMNRSISRKCQFTNNRYVSPENKIKFFGTRR